MKFSIITGFSYKLQMMNFVKSCSRKQMDLFLSGHHSRRGNKLPVYFWLKLEEEIQ